MSDWLLSFVFWCVVSLVVWCACSRSVGFGNGFGWVVFVGLVRV